MSITNEDRYTLQQRAREVLGPKEGNTMMELLPPAGCAEVATKSDLAVLRSEVRADLQSGLRQLESRMFTQFLAVLGLFATMAGLLVAVLLRT